MNDLIEQLTSTLGIDATKAEGAAGTILGLVHHHAPPGALEPLLDAAPEANAWMTRAAPALGNPDVDTGDAAGALGSMLGGGSGAAGGLGGIVQKAAALHMATQAMAKLGLPPDVAAKAIPIVFTFVRNTLGAERFAKLAGQVPMVKELAGGTGGSGVGSLLRGLGGM